MDKRQAAKIEFNENELQEILDNALPKNYYEELTLKQCNIDEQPFQKLVERLEAAESALMQAAATAKSIADLNNKSNGGGRAKKGDSSGNEKTQGEKKLCSHCNKKHAGEYWSKKGRRGGANGNALSYSKRQNDHICAMIATSTKKAHKSEDSDSDSYGDNTVEWTKGLSSVQQMYISQEYKQNNGYKSDNNVPHIEPDKLSALKKTFKKQEKQLRKWEVYATQRVGPKRQKVLKELSIGESNQQYADVCNNERSKDWKRENALRTTWFRLYQIYNIEKVYIAPSANYTKQNRLLHLQNVWWSFHV